MSDEKDLRFVRRQLRRAAEIKDPTQLWYVVRDLLNLLTLIIVPAPEVVTSETLRRAEAIRR